MKLSFFSLGVVFVMMFYQFTTSLIEELQEIKTILKTLIVEIKPNEF